MFWIGRKRSNEPTYSLVAAVSASTLSYLDTGLPPATYNYEVWAYRGATASDASNVATVTITNGTDTTPPTTPGRPIATVSDLTHVRLSWTASTDPDGPADVHHYRIERYAPQDPTTTNGYAYFDSPVNSAQDTVTAGITYRYRVQAFDRAGNASGWSLPDIATMVAFADEPLCSYADSQNPPYCTPTLLRAQHMIDLRQAVNAVVATAQPQLYPIIWTDPQLCYATAPQPCSPLTNFRGIHVRQLQTALSNALSALGIPPPTFSTITDQQTTIQKGHIEELRRWVQGK
jgi:hypothetical protein